MTQESILLNLSHQKLDKKTLEEPNRSQNNSNDAKNTCLEGNIMKEEMCKITLAKKSDSSQRHVWREKLSWAFMLKGEILRLKIDEINELMRLWISSCCETEFMRDFSSQSFQRSEIFDENFSQMEKFQKVKKMKNLGTNFSGFVVSSFNGKPVAWNLHLPDLTGDSIVLEC